MYEIVQREELAPKIVRFVVQAPQVARSHRAGQFVIVRSHDGGERIPLSVADVDREAGTITLVIQEVGTSSARFNALQQGDAFLNVVGPLGSPTHIEKFGRVVCVGGGVGCAPLHPIAKALREAGNEIVTILGGRSAQFVIMREELEKISSEMLVCTEDGSLGSKGIVTQPLKEMLEGQGKVDAVITIGPPRMMKAVCDLTRPFGVKTIVSLNSLMVDGTGMCGGCRVAVNGEAKFVCVDGPEFDGHEVDFDNFLQRAAMYREFERRSYEKMQSDHECQLDRQVAQMEQ